VKEFDMTRFTNLLSALLVAMAIGLCWSEAAAAEPKTPTEAEKVVEQIRGISMQAGRPRSDGRPNPQELRRQEIVDKLRALGKKAVPALVHALGDSDIQMRRNSLLVMISLAGPYEKKPRVDITEALPALIKATQDQDTDVRAWAAHAIAEIGPGAKAAVPALIKLLQGKYEGPRNTSCMALGAIGPAAKDALPALRAALDDPSKDVRQFARAAMTRIDKE
jgi:HEAT repeat protein